MNTNIKTLTIEQLKALAYDQLVELERIQKNINILNQEIASRNQQSAPVSSSEIVETPVEEVKPTE